MPGVGVTKPMQVFPLWYFPHSSALSKQALDVEYRGNIWHVWPQLSAAAVTTVKYECDLINLKSTLASRMIEGHKRNHVIWYIARIPMKQYPFDIWLASLQLCPSAYIKLRIYHASVPPTIHIFVPQQLCSHFIDFCTRWKLLSSM